MTTPTATAPAVTLGRPLVCASPKAGLGETGETCDRLLIASSAKPEDVVCVLLTALAGQLPPQARTTAPILLLGGRLSTHQSELFFAQCRENRETGRRLRPLASVRMETSLTVQRYAECSDWTGSTYAMVTPGPQAAVTALRWAEAAITAGAVPAAFLCEVVPYGPESAEVIAAGLVAVRGGEQDGAADEDGGEPAPFARLDPRPYLLEVLAGTGGPGSSPSSSSVPGAPARAATISGGAR
jgi:hypothetical protein